MPSFAKGSGTTTPFGRNEFLRSDRDIKTESYTLAASSVPSTIIDGVAGQKVLQPGTVLAKITSAAGSSSAADVGKVGPFSAAATDGRQTLANIVGIDLTFLPWTLTEHDVEVSVVVEARVVQAWCFEYDATSQRVTLTNTTADAMVAKKALAILFS